MSYYGLLRENLGSFCLTSLALLSDKHRQGIGNIQNGIKNYVYKVGFLQENKKKAKL